MGIQQQIGHAPMPAVAAILSRYDREQLAAFITVAIDLMDVVDGDPDIEVEDPAGETIPVIDDPALPPEEDEGDPDLEEIGAEDSFMTHQHGSGAGCSVSDPGGGAVDDEGEGVDDDTELNGDEQDDDGDTKDGNQSEDDFMFHHGSGPGCQLSDPGGACDDPPA